MHNALSKLQSILLEKKLDGFIVTNPFNILYLIGFIGISPTEREAILTVSPNSATLITARLYQTEAKTLARKNLKVKIAAERNDIDNFIKSSLKNANNVGFEETDLKYGEYIKYKKLFKSQETHSASKYSSNASEKSKHYSSRLSDSNNIKLVPITGLIENLRVIKSSEEIKKIERAQQITQKAFEQVLKNIKVGQTEAEIAQKLSAVIRILGAEGLAFETIIASGPNSGKPHHTTGNRKIMTGDTLLFDFGSKYQNYCADFSRTVFIGKATDVQRNVFNHVLTAQKKALAIIEHGIKHHEPFNAANKYFQENKLDEYFTHSLGHGIGLEVHEAPYLRSSINNSRLTNSMVFSVEPGLYFDWGGIRIEDLVTIKNGKVKVLGKLIDSMIII